MIQGTAKTEAQYRAIYLDSSSSLKDFSTDRRKYHKKYILRNSSSTMVHNTLPYVTDKNDGAPVEVEKEKAGE